jgi:hypothetical protein
MTDIIAENGRKENHVHSPGIRKVRLRGMRKPQMSTIFL